MATSRLTLRLFVFGLPDGSRTDIYSLDFASAALERRHPVTLNTGNNLLQGPAGATLLIFVPPSANTQALKVKGDLADVGHAISKTQPTVLSMASTQGLFVFNAAASVAGCTLTFL